MVLPAQTQVHWDHCPGSSGGYLRQGINITKQPSFPQQCEVRGLSEPEGLCLNLSKVPLAGRGNALHLFECKLNNLEMQAVKRASCFGKSLVLSYSVSLRQHPNASLDVLLCRNADGQATQKEIASGTSKGSRDCKRSYLSIWLFKGN